MPHPIERLRWVARADGAGASILVREAAAALATVGDSDVAGLVTGCRRLIDRHPSVGPMWWLAAKVLMAGDPVAEAWGAAAQLEDDPTSQVLAACIPDDATVTVIGWPEIAGDALRHRGDVEVLVVESRGDGSSFSRRLLAVDVDAIDVPESGMGGAIRESDIVLLEAGALGPDGFVGAAGSLAAAALGSRLDVPVWVVAGAGCVLPGRLWEALTLRLDDAGDPWEVEDEVVPLDWVTSVVGPLGALDPVEAVKRADCPIAPELLKDVR